MNGKWFKKNLTLVISGAVFVLLLAGVLWRQHRARAQQQQVEERLAAEQQRLEALRASRPFPSRENVNILRSDKLAVGEYFKNLEAKIGGTPVKALPLEPEAFHQLLAKRLRGLERQARVAGVTLPESFAFGFSRYVGTLPCRGITNRSERDQIMILLAKQLHVIEELSRILTQYRVSEVQSINRVEVEPGGPSADAVSAAIRKDPQGLSTTMPFAVQFTCGAESLRQVLNAFTETPWLLNVRRLVVNAVATAKAAPAEGAGAAAATKDAGSVDLTKAPKLVVTMDVDWVELTGDALPRLAGK
jgi:hypothetical protein